MINFALLLSYLYSVTHVKNASVPGFGITGRRVRCALAAVECGVPLRRARNPPALMGRGTARSCNTNNGDLPPWSTNNFHTTSEDGTGFLPNNGTPLNKFDGGCVLSNGWPFTYFPVGNIYYDAVRAPAAGTTSRPAACSRSAPPATHSSQRATRAARPSRRSAPT